MKFLEKTNCRNRKIRGCLGLQWEGGLIVVDMRDGSILKSSFRDGCTTV